MTLPRLAVNGSQIVRQDTGQPVLLRGANLLRFEWDGNTQAEETLIPRLANEWKGNVAMVGFASDPVLSNANHPYGGSYLGLLDKIVSVAKANNVYVVFSFRSYKVNGSQPFGVPTSNAIKALEKLAGRFKNEDHVMYAAQVETNGSANWPPNTNPTWATVKPYYRMCVDAVNIAASKKTIVMTSAPAYGRYINPAVTNRISGTIANGIRRNNVVVYKTHPYGRSKYFQGWFGAMVDAGLPVFVGEFGLTGGSADHDMSKTDVQILLDYCDTKKLGWTAWMFDYQGGPALITSNTTATPTVPYGQMVKDRMLKTPPVV